MTAKTRRSWVALCGYPGLDRFWFGNAWTGRNEGEMAAIEQIKRELATVFPTLPEVFEVHPGTIVVELDGEERP